MGSHCCSPLVCTLLFLRGDVLAFRWESAPVRGSQCWQHGGRAIRRYFQREGHRSGGQEIRQGWVYIGTYISICRRDDMPRRGACHFHRQNDSVSNSRSTLSIAPVPRAHGVTAERLSLSRERARERSPERILGDVLAIDIIGIIGIIGKPRPMSYSVDRWRNNLAFCTLILLLLLLVEQHDWTGGWLLAGYLNAEL